VLYSRFPLETCALPPRAAEGSPAGADDPRYAVVAAAVDSAYYLGRYRDIAETGLDPCRHYHDFGWKEGRNPNPWFDTGWYLEAYPDIRDAGVNPLYHYLVAGRREGRLATRPGGLRRPAAEQATNPLRMEPWPVAPPRAPVLEAEDIGLYLRKVLPGARGIVLAASHDRYIDNTGGVQVLIADEQRLFAANHVIYLHLSPSLARLTLAVALAELAAELPPARLFALHSFFGHRSSDLVATARALGACDCVFWLHDYASICDGYNLMRDKIEYCRAPAPTSLACMVCVHGDTRPAYLERVWALFSSLDFHILAPSRAALDIWLRAAKLPYLTARVHENAMLEPQPRAEPRPRPLLGTAQDPVRAAFVGFTTPQKGWPLFLDLALRCRDTTAYRFHHFAAAEALQPMRDLVGVPVKVSAANRMGMVNALSEHAIDLLLLLSPWPETFSYVAYEAFCAGADVVTLADSGNVADAVRRHGRGVVVADQAALNAFFLDGAAISYVRARTATGRETGRLRLTGTTATVDLAQAGRSLPGAMHTLAPGLTLLAGDQALRPARHGDTWSFQLPPRAGRVRLLSSRVLPEQDGGSRAKVGVAITELLLDGTSVPPGDPRRVAGWRSARDGVQWTDGDAVIDAGDATRLSVTVRLGRQYLRLAMAEWGDGRVAAPR
jgi:glycosyltransferase involved in cell wall biosynthesis